jgi:hypothetical protein
MNYTNGESFNLLTNANKFSQQRRIEGRSQSDRQNTLIKDLARDTINCALAHWYLLPGLELQRYRLRLAFSLIRTSAAARREFSILPATLYLDSDFALKSLRAQPRIGSYLDVSSPWVFPFYVLRTFQPDQAMLLNIGGTTRNFFRHLTKRTEHNGIKIQTKDLGYLSGLAESFDTITCLARLSPEEKEADLLRQMWQALNPGGTLILSVACGGAESPTDSDINGPAPGSSGQPATSPYDSDLLKTRVLDVLGEPRGYAIYGEDAVASRIDLASNKCASLRSSSWRESVSVGRYWRRCSSISQVRGRGILAMQFMKTRNLSLARQVS